MEEKREASPQAMALNLEQPLLWQEFALFKRLLYKSANQHRRSRQLQRVRMVYKQMKQLETLRLENALAALANVLKQVERAALKRSVGKSEALIQVIVPDTLGRLLKGISIVQKVLPMVVDAGAHFVGQLVQSFFMPWALSLVSMLARFHLLLKQHLRSACATYSAVMDEIRRKQLMTKELVDSLQNMNLPEKVHCAPDFCISYTPLPLHPKSDTSPSEPGAGASPPTHLHPTATPHPHVQSQGPNTHSTKPPTSATHTAPKPPPASPLPPTPPPSTSFSPPHPAPPLPSLSQAPPLVSPPFPPVPFPPSPPLPPPPLLPPDRPPPSSLPPSTVPAKPHPHLPSPPPPTAHPPLALPLSPTRPTDPLPIPPNSPQPPLPVRPGPPLRPHPQPPQQILPPLPHAPRPSRPFPHQTLPAPTPEIDGRLPEPEDMRTVGTGTGPDSSSVPCQAVAEAVRREAGTVALPQTTAAAAASAAAHTAAAAAAAAGPGRASEKEEEEVLNSASAPQGKEALLSVSVEILAAKTTSVTSSIGARPLAQAACPGPPVSTSPPAPFLGPAAPSPSEGQPPPGPAAAMQRKVEHAQRRAQWLTAREASGFGGRTSSTNPRSPSNVMFFSSDWTDDGSLPPASRDAKTGGGSWKQRGASGRRPPLPWGSSPDGGVEPAQAFHGRGSEMNRKGSSPPRGSWPVVGGVQPAHVYEDRGPKRNPQRSPSRGSTPVRAVEPATVFEDRGPQGRLNRVTAGGDAPVGGIQPGYVYEDRGQKRRAAAAGEESGARRSVEVEAADTSNVPPSEVVRECGQGRRAEEAKAEASGTQVRTNVDSGTGLGTAKKLVSVGEGRGERTGLSEPSPSAVGSRSRPQKRRKQEQMGGTRPAGSGRPLAPKAGGQIPHKDTKRGVEAMFDMLMGGQSTDFDD